MQKFEYLKLEKWHRGGINVTVNSIRVLSEATDEDFHKYLNKLGNEGWEIIDYWRSNERPDEIYHFKRLK